MNHLFRVLKILISCVFGYAVIAPLIIVAVILNSVSRQVVAFLFHILRNKHKLISGGSDNLFVLLDPNKDGSILCILLADYQPPEVKVEAEYFERILSKRDSSGQELYKKLKSIPTKKFGYAALKRDDSFDISNHVIQLPLNPADGDCFSEQEFFEKIVPSLAVSFKDGRRPMWEFLIVPKLLFQGTLKTARILRYHHVYMDGGSAGLFIVENILNFPSSSSNIYVIDPRKGISFWQSFVRGLVSLLGFVVVPYLLVSHGLEQLCQNGSKSNSCPVLPPKGSSDRIYGVSQPFHVSALKERAKTSRNRTTGVLAEIVRQSLVIHFKRRKLDLTGKPWSLVVPSAILPYKDSKPRNQVLMYWSSFPFEKEITSSLKPDLTSLSLHHAVNVFAKFPAILVQTLLSGDEKASVSTLLSSLPFTRIRGGLMGVAEQAVDAFGVYVYADTGLSINVVRYNEEVRFWIVSNSKVMNREELEDFFRILEHQLESV